MSQSAAWDERHARRGRRSDPAAFVVAAARWFSPGARVLDVAGGSGRNAVWLAGKGFEVTLIDFSPVAVRLATESAEAAGVSIDTVVRDVAALGLPPGPVQGRWDVIVMHHFLDRPGLESVPVRLAPGGVLACCQPTQRNLERNPRPSARWLLADGELADWANSHDDTMKVIDGGEGWFEGRHEARLVASRLPT